MANQSTLYIFCDGPKANANQSTLDKIKEVKKVLRSKQWTKEIHILESKENKGLARNVIEGVSHIVEKHGKAIVLEDDLMISRGFLKYMNEALNRYKSIDNIKQISGFLFPIEVEKKGNSFFMPVTNTVGWGTWKRAWSEIDFDAKGYEKLKKDRELRKKFNLDGNYNYTKMLLNQVERGTNDSWAILYWWSIFQRKGITLFPDYSLIQHNDFDSSGSHDSDFDHYNHKNWDENYSVNYFPESVDINETAFLKFKKYIKIHNKLTLKKILFKIKVRASKLIKA